jgi:hypothetical protein
VEGDEEIVPCPFFCLDDSNCFSAFRIYQREFKPSLLSGVHHGPDPALSRATIGKTTGKSLPKVLGLTLCLSRFSNNDWWMVFHFTGVET